MNNLISIPFHHQTITAIESDGEHYVAMRPIVENMGLAWQVQHRKINERFKSCVTIVVTHDTLNRKQKMLCLPVSKIAGFLYTINASKVKPELRETILLYQDKCDEVLFNHFMQQKDSAFNDLIQPLFNKHPQWQQSRDLYQYGFSTREIAELQGKTQRNVQRMIARIKKAGIHCHLANRLQTA